MSLMIDGGRVGFAYAAGSGQSLGLTSSSLPTALTRVAPGVYVLGACR